MYGSVEYHAIVRSNKLNIYSATHVYLKSKKLTLPEPAEWPNLKSLPKVEKFR